MSTFRNLRSDDITYRLRNYSEGGKIESPEGFDSYVEPLPWEPGTLSGVLVRVNEFIVGRPLRFGAVKKDDDWQFFAGDGTSVYSPLSESGKVSFPWCPLEKDAVLRMLVYLCEEKYPVTVFGKLIGTHFGLLDYGMRRGQFTWRIEDIKVDGKFLNWDQLFDVCLMFRIPTSPVLYLGDCTDELVTQQLSGSTTIAATQFVRSPFKGRAGVTITPRVESEVDGKRANYLAINPAYQSWTNKIETPYASTEEAFS